MDEERKRKPEGARAGARDKSDPLLHFFIPIIEFLLRANDIIGAIVASSQWNTDILAKNVFKQSGGPDFFCFYFLAIKDRNEFTFI